VATPCKRYRVVSQLEIAKKSIKTPILAFKVIQGQALGGNQKPVYVFL